VAGPQAAPLRDLAHDWARARGRRVLALPLPLRRRMKRALASGALVPGDEAVTGGPSFAEWLRSRDRQLAAA
jgi:hypothetical protein